MKHLVEGTTLSKLHHQEDKRMLTHSEHLNDVGMMNTSQLLPLNVELCLLNLSLKIFDGNISRTLE